MEKNYNYRFRAWCLDESDTRMVYDAECTYDYGCSGKGCMEDSFGDVLTSGRFLVMQYTRCDDLKGKPIYEEDICIINGIYYLVTFMNHTYRLRHKYSNYVLHEWLDSIEVVGNRFENPELMEKVDVWES